MSEFADARPKLGAMEKRDTTALADTVFTRRVELKSYTLKDHMGNSRATYSDLKLDANQQGVGPYTVDYESHTNYYPFGMTQELRSAVKTVQPVAGDYLYNGKEYDYEWENYDYGFRIYNPRVARFLSVDPLAPEYPWYTPYQFAGNTPIQAIDLDGLEPVRGGGLGPDSDGNLDSRLSADENNAIVSRRENRRSESSPTTGSTVTSPPSATGSVSKAQGLAIPLGGVGIDFGVGISIGIGALTLPAVTTAAQVGITAAWFLLPSNLNQDVADQITGPYAGPASITEPKPSPILIPYWSVKKNEYTYYRAMGMDEYNSTGGFLQDRRTSGEGPHVTADLSYLLRPGSFVQKSTSYDVIVRYSVRNLSPEFLEASTPFKYKANMGKGGPIFNAARAACSWYVKYEGLQGTAFGFPGAATMIFNSHVTSLTVMPKSR